MMQAKGCDASNIYDEEIPEKDRDFSDDEKEKDHKKARKTSKKHKNLEEGEIPNDDEDG